MGKSILKRTGQWINSDGYAHFLEMSAELRIFANLFSVLRRKFLQFLYENIELL